VPGGRGQAGGLKAIVAGVHIATYRHGPHLIRALWVGRDAPQVAHLSFDPKGLMVLHRAAGLMEHRDDL
jgi:hypothetical protein